MKEFGVNDRILQIMKENGLTKNAFAEKLGVSWSALSTIESHKNFPSLKIILEVLKKYPDINADWLILGIGPKERGGYTEPTAQSVAHEPAAGYAMTDAVLLREALSAIEKKSSETDRLIDVVKVQMEEMVRYGARFDHILNLMDKLYGVKFIEPKE